MVYVEIDSKDAAIHFSAEDYLMKNFAGNKPIMMIWQTDKCAMVGNYQVVEAEVNMAFANKENVQIVRRPSGGGTIYTDSGTILFTMILPFADGEYAQTVRDKVAGVVIDVLNEAGIPAKLEGRNDILLGGKKITGLAQHAKNNRLCTHGSLLYDADLEALVETLSVDEEKIRSKAIKSVRSRVTNIKEFTGLKLSTAEFLALLKKGLFKSQDAEEYTLSGHELDAIKKIHAEKYGSTLWTFEKSPPFSFSSSMRFPAGKVEIFMDIAEGIVKTCAIRGDFLGIVPISGLENLLTDNAFNRAAMESVLSGADISPYLGGITQEELLSCMFE